MAVGLLSIHFRLKALKTKSIARIILNSGDKRLPASHKVHVSDFVNDSLMHVS